MAPSPSMRGPFGRRRRLRPRSRRHEEPRRQGRELGSGRLRGAAPQHDGAGPRLDGLRPDALRSRHPGHGAGRRFDHGRHREHRGRRRGDLPLQAGWRGHRLRSEPLPGRALQEHDALRARARPDQHLRGRQLRRRGPERGRRRRHERDDPLRGRDRPHGELDLEVRRRRDAPHQDLAWCARGRAVQPPHDDLHGEGADDERRLPHAREAREDRLQLRAHAAPRGHRGSGRGLPRADRGRGRASARARSRSSSRRRARARSASGMRRRSA
jgi:hypothetical protein